MSLSMTLGFTLHDGTLTALRHGEARHWCHRDMWCLPQAGMVGVGGNDKHMGKDQRLLGSAAAGLNLVIGIWQVYLQGVLDSPGSGMG